MASRKQKNTAPTKTSQKTPGTKNKRRTKSSSDKPDSGNNGAGGKSKKAKVEPELTPEEKYKRKDAVGYSDEIADEVCKMIEVSEFGLRKICAANPWLPSASTIFQWLHDKRYPYLNDRYARARELQAEFMIERMIEIADDTSNDTEYIQFSEDTPPVARENKEWVNRSKIRVDVRKFIASKLRPKVYGDKVDVTTNGKDLPAPQQIDLTKMSYEQLKGLTGDSEADKG